MSIRPVLISRDLVPGCVFWEIYYSVMFPVTCRYVPCDKHCVSKCLVRLWRVLYGIVVVFEWIIEPYIFGSYSKASCVHMNPWWRHHMETFPALLALCEGNLLVTGSPIEICQSTCWGFAGARYKSKHWNQKVVILTFHFHFNSLFGHLVPYKHQRRVPTILEIIHVATLERAHTHAHTHTQIHAHIHTHDCFRHGSRNRHHSIYMK